MPMMNLNGIEGCDECGSSNCGLFRCYSTDEAVPHGEAYFVEDYVAYDSDNGSYDFDDDYASCDEEEYGPYVPHTRMREHDALHLMVAEYGSYLGKGGQWHTADHGDVVVALADDIIPF